MLHHCFLLNAFATTIPKYHFTGIMYPPTLEWTMFTPYATFDVNGVLCRAANEPNCTWWNAMKINAANDSVHETNTKEHPFYVGLHFSTDARDQTGVVYLNDTEIDCGSRCLVQPNCSAVTYNEERHVCIALEKFDTSNTSMYDDFKDEKLPRTRWYIKRNASNTSNTSNASNASNASFNASREIERMLDAFDCRMNTFRCPTIT